MKTTLGFASVPAVRQYLRFAQDQQLDMDRALNTAGVPRHLLDQAEARVSGEQFQALILDLLEQSGDPLFGLKSGAYVQPGSYSVLGYIVMSCSTMGEAIARIGPYEKLVGDMGTTAIEQTGTREQTDTREQTGPTGQKKATVEHEGALLKVSWHCHYPHPRVRPQMIANVLASWVTYARWLALDPAVSPVEVWFEHTPDREARLAAFEEVFHCPVRFGMPQSALLMTPEHLKLPLRQPDQLLRQTLEDAALLRIRSLPDADGSFALQVRSMIRQLLLAGISRTDAVAEQLQMAPRTLQRRLKEQNLSYQQLLDEVRQELAQDYLLNTQLSMAEISTRLGFAEPRSFHRSFKSWTGLTPGDYRNSRDSSQKAS